MKPPGTRFALLAVFLGSLLAVLEGFSNLGCASTPSILITVAGSFGAGAAMAVFIADRRGHVSNTPQT